MFKFDKGDEHCSLQLPEQVHREAVLPPVLQGSRLLLELLGRIVSVWKKEGNV